MNFSVHFFISISIFILSLLSSFSLLASPTEVQLSDKLTDQAMTSKNLTGSPMTSLIFQWCRQQQQQQPPPQQSSSSTATTRSYRILLQSTTGLATRLQAANSLSTFGKENKSSSTVSSTQEEEEEKVYRRAGLRTPSETACSDLFGGPTWLVRILEIGAELEEECHVVLVRTQTRESFVHPQLQSKITILDAAQDPWGWDSEEEEEGEDYEKRTSVSLRNLSGLFEAIRQSCRKRPGTPVLLVWESLAPLFLVHGFDRTLRFLQALDDSTFQEQEKDLVRILQLWSVRMETLTASQLAKLEDTANALLCLNRGDMTLMRQGIRETGNVVREMLPFRFVENSKADGSILPFRLEEQADEPSGSAHNHHHDEAPPLVDEKPSQLEGVSRGNVDASGTGSNRQKSARSKIQLRLESDDEASTRQTTAAPDSTNHRPLIYLQDDDPEFDDMDEEDPDDDLDI